MSSVDEGFRQLEILLGALCRDAGVRLQLGQQWKYDHQLRVIEVARDSLSQYGLDCCAGLLAHEIGHVFISVDHLFEIDTMTPGMRKNLGNSLEDRRVEAWMGQRYPGVRPWLELCARKIVKHEGMEELPGFLSFCYGCAAGWPGDRMDAKFLPPPVVAALADTWIARRQIEQTVPAPDFEAPPITPPELTYFQDRVRARLLPGMPVPADPGRIRKLNTAHTALEIIEEAVLPEAKRLYEEDVARIAGFLAEKKERMEMGEMFAEVGRLKLLARLVRQAMRHVRSQSGAPAAKHQNMARRIYEKYLLRFERQVTAEMASSVENSGDPRPYPEIVNRIAPQLAALGNTLESVLRARLRMRLKPGQAQGSRVNLKALMSYQADRRQYDRLWYRKLLPEKIKAAFLLLVDLSGSMNGEKAQAAVNGTVLMLETLERLEIPRAVYGFQDKLIPFVGFAEPLGAAQQRAISHLPKETAGDRPGGNNLFIYNDDGPCLLEAAAFLLQQPAEDRFLIVISDGLPEGRHSDAGDLRRAVQTLGQDPSLKLIGLGLGPGTNHVRDYYPQHIANIPAHSLAAKIGEVLARSILAGERA